MILYSEEENRMEIKIIIGIVIIILAIVGLIGVVLYFIFGPKHNDGW